MGILLSSKLIKNEKRAQCIYIRSELNWPGDHADRAVESFHLCMKLCKPGTRIQKRLHKAALAWMLEETVEYLAQREEALLSYPIQTGATVK